MRSLEYFYKKAENFINQLNLTEQVNLLFGTQNMKGQSNLIEDPKEKVFLCVGQLKVIKVDVVISKATL